jgi:hypothetical protein
MILCYPVLAFSNVEKTPLEEISCYKLDQTPDYFKILGNSTRNTGASPIKDRIGEDRIN